MAEQSDYIIADVKKLNSAIYKLVKISHIRFAEAYAICITIPVYRSKALSIILPIQSW